MKLFSIAALALFAAAPAFADTAFLVDFENNWAYGSTVDSTYAAAGVEFSNFLGISNNDGLGSLANGNYYDNAPSALGVAMAQLDGVVNTSAYMNVAGGVSNALSFYYSSPADVSGAIKAYSGLNGSGTLLGSFDLSANTSAYDSWSQAIFSFSGTAQSFEFTNSANTVAFDNISAVPEAGSTAMLLAGLSVLGLIARRTRR